MRKLALLSLMPVLAMLFGSAALGQRNYTPPRMTLDVGRFNMTFDRLMGDGGLQSQFSWNLTGDNRSQTEIFYWPQDRWQSNMMFQIFNPVSLDDNGILDEYGVNHAMYSRGSALTNNGATDWGVETRRYRPPHITVDGISVDAPYRWAVDPTLPCDEKIEFEDVLGQFGIRSHVEVFAFSNPNHADYFIWKVTHRFTGETKLPRSSSVSTDTLVDQTIRFWWPLSFAFGPTKIGERAAIGGFAYEGEDDLDSWFKRKSDLVPGPSRDSLAVAYYRDSKTLNVTAYSNNSFDDTGDPDRTTGHLYSTAIPGFTLLHADASPTDRTDDVAQPYAMPHASIVLDLWGRRDAGLRQTYRGDDSRGRFPLDVISAGLATSPEKGSMRFICTGPYSLTKNTAQHRNDSISFVYAVGAGGISWAEADSIGRLWLQKQITDADKDAYILRGRDSLFAVLDRANWAWDRMTRGLPIPAPPPSPDVTVYSDSNQIRVIWAYPDPSYFKDPVTGVDDWHAWRIYRKRGALMVDDPLDQGNGEQWTLVYETTNRSQLNWADRDVQRGVDYYYAVTAIDDGTQNTAGLFPGQPLESSMYNTRSLLPAAAFKPGLNETNKVRVVPNPATVAANALGFTGTPDKILFVNLPFKCRLRIYTETGDLVQTIEHQGTADHAWYQRTDANQYVASGIYILAVTDATGADGKALDNQFVKFVIVR